MAVQFPPSLKPTRRKYSPGEFPQTDFVAQNGARTVVRFGSRRVDSELDLTFSNITDDEAALILANYEEVNSVWDHVTFTVNDATTGASNSLQPYLKETNSGLRWRYAEPPTISSVNPGVSSVTCKFVGVLDGA